MIAQVQHSIGFAWRREFGTISIPVLVVEIRVLAPVGPRLGMKLNPTLSQKKNCYRFRKQINIDTNQKKCEKKPCIFVKKKDLYNYRQHRGVGRKIEEKRGKNGKRDKVIKKRKQDKETILIDTLNTASKKERKKERKNREKIRDKKIEKDVLCTWCVHKCACIS